MMQRFAELSSNLMLRVDAICDRFESDVESGPAPRIDDDPGSVSDPARSYRPAIGTPASVEGSRCPSRPPAQFIGQVVSRGGEGGSWPGPAWSPVAIGVAAASRPRAPILGRVVYCAPGDRALP
jgi:hypothetical protein